MFFEWCKQCVRTQCIQTAVGLKLYAYKLLPSVFWCVISTMYCCTSKRITNFTMEIIGFSSIWQCLWHLVPRLKKYQVNSRIYVQEFSRSLTVMESGSLGDVAEANDPPKLRRVFSPSLDPKKSSYALNFALYDCKPSRFCILGYARVFPNEYHQINLDDLCSDNGVPASATWFSDSDTETWTRNNSTLEGNFNSGKWK